MKKVETIPAPLVDLRSGSGGMFLSDKIQMADIIEIVLSQIGKADLFQSSFSISEEFLRRLFRIRQSGLLGYSVLILDHKATLKTARLWPFCSNVFSITALAANHSKILLFRGYNGDRISVLSSQNLTRGNRLESYAVSTDYKVFASLFDDYSHILTNKSIQLNDLFGRAVK